MLLEQTRAQLGVLEEENGQLRQADGRGREKAEKIDTLMKENAKLNVTLLNKVDEIEKLRQKVNKLEMDIGCEKSEGNKLRAEMDVFKQDIREQTLEIDSLRQRLHNETDLRNEVQEEQLRLQQDYSALSFSLSKAEEELRVLGEQKAQSEQLHQQQKGELKEALLAMEHSKSEAEQLLRGTKHQADRLRTEVQELAQQVEQSQQSELKHRTGIAQLEEKLTELLGEKRQLEEKLARAVASAVQIRQLSEGIVRLGSE